MVIAFSNIVVSKAFNDLERAVSVQWLGKQVLAWRKGFRRDQKNQK